MDGGKWSLGVSVRAAGAIDPAGTASSSTLRRANIPANGSFTSALSFGTASGAFNLLVAQDLTLNATTAATYDLYTGTDLVGVDGAAAPFRKLKAFAIGVISGGDATGVRVGNAAADATPLFFGAITHTATIFPSGAPLLGGSPAGVAVGTTTKNLKIENLGAAAVTIRLMLAGTDA